MPMLVRTPEEIFRAEKKDLYVIHSLEDQERDAPGLLMIKKWIGENLPGTLMELLAPSEYSGYIEGGVGRSLRVDFSPEGLKTFCDRWEVNDASVDKRFQCFIHLYQRWYEAHGRFVPTPDKPKGKGPIVWWHTPLGFLHHQLSVEKMNPDDGGRHPANHRDIWAQISTHWPEMISFDPDEMSHGRISVNEAGLPVRASYTLPFDDNCIGYTSPTKEIIRDWFDLSKECSLTESYL